MSAYKKLTILHSNDMHGDFLAERIEEGLIGGVSMLSGYVQKVRQEETNVIYCIAGDMFRGSIIDSEYKGISTIEIMNAIAPDVVTLGNHEIDYGIAHLLFLEKCAKFPIVNSNLYIKSNHSRLFQPYFIKEIDGMRILFIGIITESVLHATRNETHIGTLVDVYDAAMEIGRICNAYKTTDIDLTVLLTHIGFEQDKELAACLDPAWGVDLIIGGHSHTALDQAVVVNDIAIVQAKTGTDQIGRFDLLIDTAKNKIHSYKWKCISIEEAICPKDIYVEKLLANFKQQTDKKYGRIITRLSHQLTHPTRIQQTEIGHLFTNIVARLQALDLMFIASGSIRAETLGPLVHYADLVTAFPYDSPLFLLKINGVQLHRMISYMLKKGIKGNGYFQISERLQIQDADCEEVQITFDGMPLDEKRIFRIGMMEYHYHSFVDYFGFPKEEFEKENRSCMIATSIRDILEEGLLKMKI